MVIVQVQCGRTSYHDSNRLRELGINKYCGQQGRVFGRTDSDMHSTSTHRACGVFCSRASSPLLFLRFPTPTQWHIKQTQPKQNTYQERRGKKTGYDILPLT